MNSFEQAEKIIKILEDNEYEAYIVGGAVRDMLLDVECNDIDIASSATPKQITELFDNVVQTGEKYGTVTVILNGEKFEITKFRCEGEYEDCRHPLYVLPAGTIEEDLSRRDFTINAMAYNKNKGIIDLYGGVDDLKAGIIRTVGNPSERFSEDSLRIMRAYRFASSLGFRIDSDTASAAIEKANFIRQLSIERVAAEFLRTLSGEKPSVMNSLLETGALENFGINVKDISICDSCENNILIRFAAAALAGDTAPQDLASKLCLSHKFIADEEFIYKVMTEENLNKITIKKLLKKASFELFNVAISARHNIFDEDISYYQEMTDIIRSGNEPYRIADLQISGNELLQIGFSGKEIGVKLDQLLDEVLQKPELNEKEKLLELLR